MTNASEVLVRQPDLEPARAIDGETRAPRRLNHQRALESESIHILREAAAEFARPVMLYSIGKDSSAMLRQAQHGRRVFSDGIEHHGAGEFGSGLAENVNAFGFERALVIEPARRAGLAIDCPRGFEIRLPN